MLSLKVSLFTLSHTQHANCNALTTGPDKGQSELQIRGGIGGKSRIIFLIFQRKPIL